MGTHATKVAENLSNKDSQKLLNRAKKSTTDAIKTASKKAIQKIATGDLIGNKIADQITSISKSQKNDETKNDLEIPKERYISPEKKTTNY